MNTVVLLAPSKTPETQVPASPLSGLIRPQPFKPTRSTGLECYGGLETACLNLATAISKAIGERFTAATGLKLAESLGVTAQSGKNAGAVLLNALRAGPLEIFLVLPKGKVESALGLSAITEFNRDPRIKGSNRITAESLHKILSPEAQNQDHATSITLTPHEADLWRSKLLNSPYQSSHNPLGVEDLAPVLALMEIYEVYDKIQDRIANIKLK